ncbi:hypothetical protein LSAT2_030881 [Lamellibrachia satsuma]|nr:hypothetical protein LSAT2_030881 [Lamellibrachia satsuma]
MAVDITPNPRQADRETGGLADVELEAVILSGSPDKGKVKTKQKGQSGNEWRPGVVREKKTWFEKTTSTKQVDTWKGKTIAQLKR